MRRWYRTLAGLLILLALAVVSARPAAGSAMAAEQCFSETGYCIRGLFLDHWRAHGGVVLNGFPLSDPFPLQLEDGQTYTVQYFERVRLELHPEIAPDAVEVGMLGRHTGIGGDDLGAIQRPDATYFPETRHNVLPDLFAFWETNGGLDQFGYPLTEEIGVALGDGRRYTVQFFERARFERHPDGAGGETIILGQLGRQFLPLDTLASTPGGVSALTPATPAVASGSPFTTEAINQYLFNAGIGGPLFVLRRGSNVGLECLTAREARDRYGLAPTGVADDRLLCAVLISGEFVAGAPPQHFAVVAQLYDAATGNLLAQRAAPELQPPGSPGIPGITPSNPQAPRGQPTYTERDVRAYYDRLYPGGNAGQYGTVEVVTVEFLTAREVAQRLNIAPLRPDDAPLCLVTLRVSGARPHGSGPPDLAVFDGRTGNLLLQGWR